MWQQRLQGQTCAFITKAGKVAKWEDNNPCSPPPPTILCEQDPYLFLASIEGFLAVLSSVPILWNLLVAVRYSWHHKSDCHFRDF